jgi:hypothetical protein
MTLTPLHLQHYSLDAVCILLLQHAMPLFEVYIRDPGSCLGSKSLSEQPPALPTQ